jgi:hypothetical protein
MATSLLSDSDLSSFLTYPYIVIRYSENSVKNCPIWFIKKSDKELLRPDSKNLVVAIPDEFDEDEGVDVPRGLIIDSAKAHMMEQRHALCVVFSESDCVYLEHDGSIYESEVPPSSESKFEF